MALSSILILLLALPCEALLTEDTPERQVFLGYPASAPDLTVNILRRKDSYGIYLFRSDPLLGRLMTRNSFVGLVEGSNGSVDIDRRAAAFFKDWFTRTGKLPTPNRIGTSYRYKMESPEWSLAITVRSPLKSYYVTPGNLISQLYCQSAQLTRMEKLSRALDLEHFRLRDRMDLKSLIR